MIVALDEPGLLATYIAEGAPFRFPPGNWPTDDGSHPWHERAGWEGHGVLMLQRPEEMHAVWVFWEGPERRFDGWYVNIQEPFRRTVDGYDTQDLELDVLVSPDGTWIVKDDDFLEQRVAEGRFTEPQIASVRAEARRIASALDAGDRWWSDGWAQWMPDPSWGTPTFPERFRRSSASSNRRIERTVAER